MLTWTQMKKQAADNCGLYVDAPEMVRISRDINTGVKRFQNAARRYWTRGERKINIAKDKVYYQLPSDVLRVSSVQVKRNGHYHPITQIRSEEQWNQLGSAPAFAANSATHYFIKGSNEIGIYPTPSENVASVDLIAGTPSSSGIKVFNGSERQSKPLKRWSGTVWENANLKRYDGSNWV